MHTSSGTLAALTSTMTLRNAYRALNTQVDLVDSAGQPLVAFPEIYFWDTSFGKVVALSSAVTLWHAYRPANTRVDLVAGARQQQRGAFPHLNMRRLSFGKLAALSSAMNLRNAYPALNTRMDLVDSARTPHAVTRSRRATHVATAKSAWPSPVMA